MRVIEDNYSDVQQITCSGCTSKLEYNVQDVHHNENGYYIRCPLCGQITYTYLDADTEKEEYHYPDTFFRFCKDSGAVEIDDKEVNKCIAKCISELRNNPDEHYYFYETGDMVIVCLRLYEGDEEETKIIVSKDSYEMDI